jgi:4-alpha-glucanotransferase
MRFGWLKKNAGMRVLQFAFNGDPGNPYLPHNYSPNCVAYTGTHDNNTTRGWFDELPYAQRQNLWNYLRRPAGQSAEATCQHVSRSAGWTW